MKEKMEKMGGGDEWLILLKDFISRKNYEKIYDGLLKPRKKYDGLVGIFHWCLFCDERRESGMQ